MAFNHKLKELIFWLRSFAFFFHFSAIHAAICLELDADSNRLCKYISYLRKYSNKSFLALPLNEADIDIHCKYHKIF